MIPSAKPPAPPGRRWWLLVALVGILQLALIFSLGGYLPIQPHQGVPAPKLRFAGPAASEWVALNDPTLFGLPHAEGFSGLAWLRIPSVPPPARDWSEPPQLLALPIARLGVAIDRWAQTNEPGWFATPVQMAPEFTWPEPPLETFRPGPSTFRVEGDLAQRRLVTPLALGPWAHSDLLTNSVVQMVVNELGRPISVTLLSGCGKKEADDRALELAAAARFSPIPPSQPGKAGNPAGQLTWGQLVIQWQTSPLPPANAPPPKP